MNNYPLRVFYSTCSCGSLDMFPFCKRANELRFSQMGSFRLTFKYRIQLKENSYCLQVPSGQPGSE